MTTTKHEPLKELYLEALVNDAYHGGVVSTICDAVLHNCELTGQSPSSAAISESACVLTRHAMGTLEVTISRISDDQVFLPDDTDWPRVDAFWDGPSSPEERSWVIGELRTQAERCFHTHQTFADPEGSRHNGGIHWAWIADLKIAGILLLAAASLLKQEDQ